jgi:serine/threonine protein kinase
MGTPSYMAPEQKEHPDAVDHRADIYALGVVFYQLLTGELPGQEIEVPSSKVQIDVRLDEVVLRALAKQPELRFQQVSEVKTMVATIVAMNPALAPAPAPSSPPTLDPNPKHMKTKNLQSIVMFILIAVLGVSLAYEMIQRHRLSQRLAQPQTQPGANDLQQARREKFMQAMAQDRKRYSDAQIREAEQLYQIANKKWGAPEAIESLKTMIKKYPDLDRTGCGALYLAQMSQGDERARYLQDCLEKYNDCFYGDGVQVGAYARFLLVQDYRSQGEAQKAEALSAEIKTKYAGAIDHDGNLLKDGLKTGSN